MATKKATPNTQRTVGAIIGGVLIDRAMKMAGGALAGLTTGIGAIDFAALNKKKAAVAAATLVAGVFGAGRTANALMSGVSQGAATAGAIHLADEAAGVFGGGLSGLGNVAANLDLYEDAPVPSGVNGTEYGPQFTGTEYGPQFTGTEYGPLID